MKAHSIPPLLQAHPPVLNGLGHMIGHNRLAARQIGNGPGQPQDAMIVN